MPEYLYISAYCSGGVYRVWCGIPRHFPGIYLTLGIMNQGRPPPRRLNTEALRHYLEAASDEEVERHNDRDTARYETEYDAFSTEYQKGKCYLCHCDFKTISRDRPCVHWLLRRGKFKKNDFPLLFEKFGFTQLAAFTRWAANQEQPLSAINDLDVLRGERKVFEFTVRWKNIEWTFDCSKNDYEGHDGLKTNFPHFHLQMRIDGRAFIDFGDFHIPFTEEDLFRIDVSRDLPSLFHVSYGDAGLGMQFASELDPDTILEETEVTDDLDKATYRMQTIITSENGSIDMQALLKAMEQSRATGEPIASLARKHLGDEHSIRTIISPGDGMPEIAKRSERKRR